MKTKKKVYCSDCRYFKVEKKIWEVYNEVKTCLNPNIGIYYTEGDYTHKPVKEHAAPCLINKHNNCEGYEYIKRDRDPLEWTFWENNCDWILYLLIIFSIAFISYIIMSFLFSIGLLH